MIALYEAAFLIGVLQLGTTDVGKGVPAVVAAIALGVGGLVILIALAGWIGRRAAPMTMFAVAGLLVAAGGLSASGPALASGIGLVAFGVVLMCIPWALRERA